MAIPEDPTCCGTPGKWLAIGGVTGSKWRLPGDANLDFLEAQIKAAMRARDSITVDVVAGRPSRTVRLVLNGSALHFVELIEEDAG